MSQQITATIVKEGSTTTLIVAERLISPLEIVQILNQKKIELGFDYVQEVAFPAGEFGQPKWTGDEAEDALAKLALLIKSPGHAVLGG